MAQPVKSRLDGKSIFAAVMWGVPLSPVVIMKFNAVDIFGLVVLNGVIVRKS